MSRHSVNEYKRVNAPHGHELINGFDYELQCWVVNGIIQRCGHMETENCECIGRHHEGQKLIDIKLE